MEGTREKKEKRKEEEKKRMGESLLVFLLFRYKEKRETNKGTTLGGNAFFLLSFKLTLSETGKARRTHFKAH